MRRLAAVAILGVLLSAGCGEEDGGGEPGRTLALALDFQPNAVHAGIFTAARTGADHRRGIRLDIRVPSSSTDSLKLLASRRAHLAVVDIHDLALARERGQDLVGLAPLVKRPLAAVIVRPRIRRPRDLEGRRVGISGLPSDTAVLGSVVGSDGGDVDRVNTVTIGFSAVRTMVARRVDAVVAFWNAEGVALRRVGERTREFRVDDYGAPPYPELVLVTRRELLRRDRARLRAAVAAIEEGSATALEDRAAAIDDIARASGAERRLVAEQLEAVAAALRPPLRLDRSVLERFAAFDLRFGVLKRPLDVERAFAVDG